MRTSLKHLGINDSNYKVLKLLPLVYVAWANGRIEAVQAERVVELARNQFDVDDHGEQILRNWMAARPSKQYFEEGLHDILLLAHAPDDWNFTVDELQGLLAHAEGIARASAEALGVAFVATPEEEQALQTLAEELEVDDGESWAALLSELGAANTSSTTSP